MRITIEVSIAPDDNDGLTGGKWALEGENAHCYQWLAEEAIEGELHNVEIDFRAIELFRDDGHAIGDNTTHGTWIAHN